MGKISRDCDKDVTSKKVGAHATFWENWWAKAGPNRASIDSSEKRIMLDYQLTVLLVNVVYVQLSLKIPNQYRRTREDTRGAPSVLPIH